MIEKPDWLNSASAPCSAVTLAAIVLEDEKATPGSAQIRWQSTRDGLLLKSALASITDIDGHGVCRFAINGHHDIHSASATDGLWKFDIHLIYAHQLGMRAEETDFGLDASDQDFDVGQTAATAKACAVQHQVIRLGSRADTDGASRAVGVGDR